MARIFITGSAQGLGLNAGLELLSQGHEVILHARSADRGAALRKLAPDATGVAVGDLRNVNDIHKIAEQVNGFGTMDAIIHNAGLIGRSREATPKGWPATLAVNTIAPYMLTTLLHRPSRLIYLSSGMHRSGTGSLNDFLWERRPWNSNAAYSESKLHVAALSAALSRLWPEVLSNAVDPGWVPTRMGGSGAPDDLEKGHDTQCWLAVSDDQNARTSGGYWHHRRKECPASEVTNSAFQDQLLGRLEKLTGLSSR